MSSVWLTSSSDTPRAATLVRSMSRKSCGVLERNCVATLVRPGIVFSFWTRRVGLVLQRRPARGRPDPRR